jgi:hypothetical protein
MSIPVYLEKGAHARLGMPPALGTGTETGVYFDACNFVGSLMALYAQQLCQFAISNIPAPSISTVLVQT